MLRGRRSGFRSTVEGVRHRSGLGFGPTTVCLQGFPDLKVNAEESVISNKGLKSVDITFISLFGSQWRNFNRMVCRDQF